MRKITVNHNQTLVCEPGIRILNHNQAVVQPPAPIRIPNHNQTLVGSAR